MQTHSYYYCFYYYYYNYCILQSSIALPVKTGFV